MPTERELKERYGEARASARAGDYAQALEGCLYYLDNSDGPVRLSFTLADIMSLSQHLPEARQALMTRRDNAKALILAGEGGLSILQDFRSFNKYLEQNDENVAFLEILSQAGEKFQPTYQNFLDLIWEDLAASGRYRMLENIIEGCAKEIAGWLTFAYVRWDYAATDADRESEKTSLRYHLATAVLAYETLLALGKDAVAEKLARWTISCEPLTEARARLMEVAEKLGRSDAAAALATLI